MLFGTVGGFGMTIENTGRGRRLSGMALAILAVSLAGVSVPATSQAQELTEIVVTSRKIEEKLKDVPLAITAFDSGTIAAAGISSLQDVANLTPGLSFFNAFGENLPVPIIRGVVPQDIFGVNAVAIFVDNVYVSGREGLNFSQLDVERIEVVKGPQSALYGRNAFSGAINYVTKAPSDDFESKSEAEVGNRGKQRVMGQVSGPIFRDDLTGRISAMYDEWDGSYDNTLAPENDIGGYRYRSLQGRLRWQPADSLDINLGLYSSNDEIDEPVVGGLPANCEDQVETTTENATNGPFERLQNWCGAVPGLAALPDALDPAQFPNRVSLPNSITSDSLPKNALAVGENRDLLRGNLNVAWDAGFGTFTFLTGYSDTEQDSVSDFNRSSGSSLPFVFCPGATTSAPPPFCNGPDFSYTPMGFINVENGTTTEEWSQEIRFTGPQDQRLRYTTGLYYFGVKQTDFPGAPVATTPLPASIADIGLGPLAYPTSLAIGSYIFGTSTSSIAPDGTILPFTVDGAVDPLIRASQQEKTESWSVFGAMDFDITEALTARAEIRFTHESLRGELYQYQRCSQPRDALNPRFGSNDPSVFPFNDPDVTACGDDYYDLRALAPVTTQASARFKIPTGRLGLQYKLESGWMAYASVALGDKPGGVQLLEADVLNDDLVAEPEVVINRFDEEKLLAYELGIKGYSADRRIGLDMAVFYNDWNDIVLRQLTERSPGSGRLFEQPTGLNVNAGDARVWGWEMTADLAMTDNLTGRLTAAWTDSQLKDAAQDSYALFPGFYTKEPSCVPAAIQALPEEEQIEKDKQCRLISGDLSGNTQMRQPEWTASASLTYEREVAGDWSWSTRADANYLGKIFVGNENQAWLPSRTNVNLRTGFTSPSKKVTVELWVRNLFENNSPIAAFRDIYFTNDSDISGQENPTDVRAASNFDDFPPFRLSVTYPSLRTFGILGKVRFGGAAD